MSRKCLNINCEYQISAHRANLISTKTKKRERQQQNTIVRRSYRISRERKTEFIIQIDACAPCIGIQRFSVNQARKTNDTKKNKQHCLQSCT